MRYQIVAIGRLKRGFFQSGCAHYQKRLEAHAKISLQELKEGRSAEAQQAESQALLNAAEGHLIALDETGKTFASRPLAEHIGALETRGISRLSLLIGGADGHHASLLSQVAERWSLSPLTLPHELARLVLLEQLYRAETIRAGHPYHRD